MQEADSADELPPNCFAECWEGGSLLARHKRGGDDAAAIHDFMLVLCACHTVIPERGEDGAIAYQASSPDEGALVDAARRIGWEFVSRTSTSLRYLLGGEERALDVLAVNEFTSSRKRMSILVREREGGAYSLLLKGADDVVFDKLAVSNDRHQP